jgi:hypothetical protein
MLLQLLKLFNTPVMAEWCAFIAAILLLRKRATIWQLFIPFLFITICAETTGWFIAFILKKRGNSWVFNINLLISVCFSLWMLSNAAPLQKIKNNLYAAIVIFIAFAIVNWIFFQGLFIYDTITEVVGDIIFIITSCYFFYAVLNEETYRNLFRYEYFWFANGLLFYALGGVVLFLFFWYIKTFGRLSQFFVYGYINDALNVLLYGSFITAFICRKMNTK